MNRLLSAPLNHEVVRPSSHDCEHPTMHRGTPIMTRIEWCQQNKMKARTEAESEGWDAEEEGLRDACSVETASISINIVVYAPRYQLGLEDGQALLRIA